MGVHHLRKIGGTANIRLSKTNNEQYEMILNFRRGTDRSILQKSIRTLFFLTDTIIFCLSPILRILLLKKNYAYVLGKGEGEKRKRTTYFEGSRPSSLDRYEGVC